jgi:tetratricopeptide (TPR) repeat protein
MLCEALMPLQPAPNMAGSATNASRNDCHFSFTRPTICAEVMIATPNSALCFRRHGAGAILGLCLVLLSRSWAPAADQPAPSPYARARTAYTIAKQDWQKNASSPDAAWQFAQACFDLAELDEEGRARIAQEAIDACRKSLITNTNAGNYYYLGLNLGQLARTKKLGALKLVDEMEVALKKAIETDPKFDYAGADRSLGMLYRDAPGWPASIGSRSKAKQHLAKAVQLAPQYPGNHISLIESFIAWGDLNAARTAVSQAEPHLRQARLELTGDRWKESWRDWDHSWERIRRRTGADLTSPRGKQ